MRKADVKPVLRRRLKGEQVRSVAQIDRQCVAIVHQSLHRRAFPRWEKRALRAGHPSGAIAFLRLNAPLKGRAVR